MPSTADLVRLHNPMQALPGFTFGGIDAYSTRSMTCSGGVTVASSCGDAHSLRGTHHYYRRLGLGPEELVLVQTPESGDLYQAILEDAVTTQKIIELVGQDRSVEFFCTREGIEEDFVEQLGLDWSRVASHPSVLSDRWNNKSTLRSIARENGLGELFPEHRLVDSQPQLERAVGELLARHSELVIKRSAWASGIGMVFGASKAIVAEYTKQHGGVPVGTIVEQSLGSEHLSMSIVSRFEDGRLVQQWFTEQECPLEDGSVVHEGSILGETPRVRPADIEWMRQATAPLYQLILSEKPNLTGIVNFDCIRGADQRFVLECNARVTFSTYIEEIRQAMMATRKEQGHPSWSQTTCLMRSVRPKRARSFAALSRELGPYLLTNPVKDGVIPIVLGCLPLSGYCYLVAVGQSFYSALRAMAEAKVRLEV